VGRLDGVQATHLGHVLSCFVGTASSRESAVKGLTRSKGRWTTAGLAAVILAGGAYAYAATLTVHSTTLGAGGTTVASCQSHAYVGYNTQWDASRNQFDVASVTVTTPSIGGGVFPCALLNVDAALTGSGTHLPYELGHQTLNGFGFYTWLINTVTTPINAANVTDVEVAITG